MTAMLAFLTQEGQKTGRASVESVTGNFRVIDPKDIRVLAQRAVHTLSPDSLSILEKSLAWALKLDSAGEYDSAWISQ